MKSKQFMRIFYNFFDEKLAPLSPNALAGYLHIRKRYNGANNGAISFSCRELADCLGKSKSTAKNIFDELLQSNLISISKNSSFNVKIKYARLWIINDLKKQKSVPHFKRSVHQRIQDSPKHQKDGAKNE